MIRIYTVLGMLVLGFAACSEKEQPINQIPGTTPQSITNEALVGSYVVTKVESRSGNQRSDVTTDWFRIYAGNCTKDDVTVLKPDNSFMVLDGAIACDESTDDTGTWKLLGNTQLKIDADTAIIEAFSATTLRITSPAYSTPQSELIFTYTRK